LLSLASLTQLVLPRVLRLGNDDAVAIWVPVWIRLLGAGALALGAVLPERHLARLGRGAIAFGTSLVVASIAAAALISTGLERQLDVKVDPGASASPDLASTPAVTVSQLLLASLFAVAAVGFLRQARRSQQPLDTWLAVGSAVAAVARVQYALYPSLYTAWLYTGDVMQLAAYVCWLVGASLEIRDYWRATARVAALDERQRIARELHDGLAHELSFIRTTSNDLAAHGDDRRVTEVAHAAERALDESRRAISALSRPVDQSLDDAVVEAAELVAHRAGVAVRVDVMAAVDVDAEAREVVVRIVREAVTNAARHGAAHQVRLRLEQTAGQTSLSISDDGCGFDPEAETAGTASGFGIISMRERAASIGGDLALTSAPGSGTVVRVRWPAE
jgi:signal transduction histidine kinase